MQFRLLLNINTMLVLYKQGLLTKSDAGDGVTICDLDFHELHFC